MARTKDKNSTRQKALRALDGMQGLKREECLKRLAKKFPDAADAYLETLWATHRRESRKNGGMVTVFTVADIREGVQVEPHIKHRNVFQSQVSATDALTPEKAVDNYIKELQVRMEQAKSRL